MKRAALRPQAKADLRHQVRYYRKEAGVTVAGRLVDAAQSALTQLERQPRIGSPAIGQVLDIAGLRAWRITAFPLVWLYFERDDHLDVVRLLGERQDIAAILGGESPS